ncbi:MAG: hypothetical protein ACO2PM_24890 [Pyrobaculum sp.]
MTCRVERWRSDPYYGAVAVVKAGDGYVVGDIRGWILGVFQKYAELPPDLSTGSSGCRRRDLTKH